MRNFFSRAICWLFGHRLIRSHSGFTGLCARCDEIPAQRPMRSDEAAAYKNFRRSHSRRVS